MDESVSFLMEKLRAKGGTYKSFKEYAKSLRMTLLEKRYVLEVSERNYLQECLDLLQQNILVSTLPAIIERLEVVSRHLGLKFVSGPSKLEWFISSDMFYVEVLLESNGHIKDVKIHHDGTGERQSCEELKKTLENRDFKDFTLQLEGLISIYNLNADQKVKSKAFTSLQYLESDIMQLSELQCSYMTDPFDIIYKSDVGLVQKRRGGHPMKIIYFVSPYDLLDTSKKIHRPLTLDLPEVDYSVSLCLESSSTNKLQTQSLVKILKSEKIDETGKSERPMPLFDELTTQNTNLLPACFIMKLKERMPICETLINRMKEITDIEVNKLDGPYPILSLIKREIHKKYVECEEDSSIVILPDQRHCYIMTNNYDLQAYIVQSIPFSQPAHVSKILPLLRQQALFNSFIASCIRPKAAEDSCDKLKQNFSRNINCDSEYTNGFGLKLFGSEDFKSLSIFNESSPKSVSHVTMFEVMPLSLQQITVSFEHPVDETLITAELDLSDVLNLRCNISMASEDSNASLANAQECAGRVLQRSFSIPVTMRILIRLWENQYDSSEEEDLNESSTNNDVTDLIETTDTAMETDTDKENNECSSGDFNSSAAIKLEVPDSGDNSFDGFPALNGTTATRGDNFNIAADNLFANPYPSFEDAEILPTSTFDSPLSFLDNANEQPMFEPKNERADSTDNRYFKSKSDLSFVKKRAAASQRDNSESDVIDCTSDSESSSLETATVTKESSCGSSNNVDAKETSPGSNSSLEFSAITDITAVTATTTEVTSSEKTQDFQLDHSLIEVNDLEGMQHFLKMTEPTTMAKSNSTAPKNEERPTSNVSSYTSSLISDLEGCKNLTPSVSITPVSSMSTSAPTPPPPPPQQPSSTAAISPNVQSLFTSMGLDRRPGIDVSITHFSQPTTTTLPSSLTITPVTMKESDERAKERKKMKSVTNVDDKMRQQEKKKKRKHEDRPMGPPEKIPAKADPLSRPTSVSIKPVETASSLSSTPRSPSPNTAQRRYAVSPTQPSPVSLMGKISPNNGGSGNSNNNNVKNKPSVSSAPPSLSGSPKMSSNSSNVSPKHINTSSPPKNASSGSSGKPSLPALKAVSSPSSSKNNDKSKSHKDASVREYKEKKSSNGGSNSSSTASAGDRQSPKPFKSSSSTAKLPQKSDNVGTSGLMSPQYDPTLVGGGFDAKMGSITKNKKLMDVVDRLTNSKTEDNGNGNGVSKNNGNATNANVSGARDAKNNALITDPKTNQLLVKGATEHYMVKAHSGEGGIRMTINRKNRDLSTSRQSSGGSSGTKAPSAPGNDSPKHGPPKSGSGSIGDTTITKKSTSSGTKISNSSGSKVSGSSGSSLSKHSSSKSSMGSSYKSKSNHGPKLSSGSGGSNDPNRKEKIRPPKTHSDKVSRPGENAEGDKQFKMHGTSLPVPANYQIPKISDRNKVSGEQEPKKSVDAVQNLETAPPKDNQAKIESSTSLASTTASSALSLTSSSPHKISLGILEERGVTIEPKNVALYEANKPKPPSENSVESTSAAVVAGTTSQHQMANNCSITAVQANDSIKLNL